MDLTIGKGLKMLDNHYFWSLMIVFSLGFFAFCFADRWTEPEASFVRAMTIAIPTSGALWAMILWVILNVI